MNKIYKILIILLLLTPFTSNGQSINIGDGASIRMNDGDKLIILGSSPDAFVDNGQTTGGIIMEGENAEVIWKVDNNTGTYMVPFSSPDGTRIPFTYEITTPGTGGGEIHFTSYQTGADNLPTPQAVPILDEYGFDNSLNMVDRWWVIEPVDYTTKPQGSYTFTYTQEDIDGGNFLTEANLTTQRYNDDDNRWLDWLYGPTVNTTINQVTILITNPLDQYPVWTLVDISDPLPIELIRLRVDCEELTVNWTTATETNSDYVTVQGSNDAYSWDDIIDVQTAGNSNQYLNYTTKVTPYNYYRLNQFDLDGSSEYSDVIYGCPDFESGEVMLYPTVNDGRFFLSHNSTYQIDIFDMSGRCVFSEKTSKNYFDMGDISNGKYILRMSNNIDYKTFKFIKTWKN